jgi:pimeloyl-ACP methyl ester carboxylesterase
VNEWNQQSVFAGSQIEPERVESDYDRKLLSLALTQWSQVEQENSVEFLLQDPIPKLWVVGQNDKKYLEQSQQLQASSNIENIVIPNSGHRVILDQPQLLKQQIQLFLEKIHLL